MPGRPARGLRRSLAQRTRPLVRSHAHSCEPCARPCRLSTPVSDGLFLADGATPGTRSPAPPLAEVRLAASTPRPGDELHTKRVCLHWK